MGDLILLSDHKSAWREVFRVDDDHVTLRVYEDPVTGEVEVFQMNSAAEGVRSCLTPAQVASLSVALQGVARKFEKG